MDLTKGGDTVDENFVRAAGAKVELFAVSPDGRLSDAPVGAVATTGVDGKFRVGPGPENGWVIRLSRPDTADDVGRRRPRHLAARRRAAAGDEGAPHRPAHGSRREGPRRGPRGNVRPWGAQHRPLGRGVPRRDERPTPTAGSRRGRRAARASSRSSIRATTTSRRRCSFPEKGDAADVSIVVRPPTPLSGWIASRDGRRLAA